MSKNRGLALAVLGMVVAVAGMVFLLEHGGRRGPASAPPIASRPQSSPASAPAVVTVVGEPIDEGFVFIDGAYIDAPYRVSSEIRGDTGQVLINGNCVFEREETVVVPVPTTDPSIPASFNRDTSIYDYEVTSWLACKAFYVVNHYPLEEHLALREQYLRSLPFVKSVTVNEDNSIITITTYRGEEMGILAATFPPDDPNPPKLSEVIEKARSGYEQELAGDPECFIFDRGAGERLSGADVPAKLLSAVKVLRGA